MELVPITEQLDFLFRCVLEIVILDLIYLGFVDTILPNKFSDLSYCHLFRNTSDIFTQVDVWKIEDSLWKFVFLNGILIIENQVYFSSNSIKNTGSVLEIGRTDQGKMKTESSPRPEL